MIMISRLTHGFNDRCLRFASTVTDARARLASGWRAAPLPGGGRTRWVTMKGFRLHPSPFPGLTLTLARISHTFFQNKREAADFLSFPYFGEKQSVCGAC